MILDRWDSYRYVPGMREPLEITVTEHRALLDGETLVLEPSDVRKFGEEITIDDGPFVILPDPDYEPLEGSIFDMDVVAVKRHGDHEGQEEVEGQQGGSAKGYSHKGGAAKGEKRGGRPKGAVEPTTVRQTVEPAEYNSVFEAAMADNEFSAFVDHNSEEELGNMKALYLSEDGKAGIAIKEHDDGRVEITQAFNGGAEPGTALRMIQQSINEDGVNYAEAFGPFLTAHYARVGLVIDETFPFDDEQAPDNWNYEKHGRPDYHTMRLEK